RFSSQSVYGEYRLPGRREPLPDVNASAQMWQIRTIQTMSGAAIAPLITAREVALALNVSEEWVRQRARAGELPSVRLGDAGKRSPQRFRPADLERLIRANAKPPELVA